MAGSNSGTSMLTRTLAVNGGSFDMFCLRLRSAAVEVRDRYRREVDSFEAANVHGRHVPALGVRAFAVRMHAAVRAEAMLDVCLLNVYVLAFASGVSSFSRSCGTNHNSEPLRWQIEQLQDNALSIVPSTSKAIRPQ